MLQNSTQPLGFRLRLALPRSRVRPISRANVNISIGYPRKLLRTKGGVQRVFKMPQLFICSNVTSRWTENLVALNNAALDVLLCVDHWTLNPPCLSTTSILRTSKSSLVLIVSLQALRTVQVALSDPGQIAIGYVLANLATPRIIPAEDALQKSKDILGNLGVEFFSLVVEVKFN